MDNNINANGYDYVDLGLPSGTLWATMNVGADKTSDAGLYFQWGDIVGYTKDQVGKDKQFNWTSYKWNPSCDGETFTKYAKVEDTLDLEDDAAHVHMGGDWHMPTPEQIKELIDYTGCGRVMMERIGGSIFTSAKDRSKSICIPSVGSAEDGFVEGYGSYSIIWSSALSTYAVDFGQFLSVNLDGAYLSSYSRGDGFPIRGVIG